MTYEVHYRWNENFDKRRRRGSCEIEANSTEEAYHIVMEKLSNDSKKFNVAIAKIYRLVYFNEAED